MEQGNTKKSIQGTVFPEVRYADSGDDPLEISKVYEESWKYAYRGIIPQDYLDAVPAGRWTSVIDHPDWKTLVCVENGRIVGTSSFCFSRFEQYPDWGEVISLCLSGVAGCVCC